MAKTKKVKKKVSKSKTKTPSKIRTKAVIKAKEINKSPIKISKTYLPKDTEKYMCEKHRAFFKMKLQEWRKEFNYTTTEAKSLCTKRPTKSQHGAPC